MSAPRMTAQDATNGEPQPFKGTVLLDGLYGILRTCGRIATGGRGEWGNKPLIKANRKDEQAL